MDGGPAAHVLTFECTHNPMVDEMWLEQLRSCLKNQHHIPLILSWLRNKIFNQENANEKTE